ncbi:MAG: hypothetical protein WAZ19_02395 [Anaerolineae bacterium]
MSKKLKTIGIDDKYYIDVYTDCITLRSEVVLDELNDKGNNKVSKNFWYYSNIPAALKKYLQESAADNTDVKSILKRIDEVEKLIDSKF